MVPVRRKRIPLGRTAGQNRTVTWARSGSLGFRGNVAILCLNENERGTHMVAVFGGMT